jgi:hypothetical protein
MTGWDVSTSPWRGCHAVEWAIDDWRIEIAYRNGQTRLRGARLDDIIDGSCALEVIRELE